MTPISISAAPSPSPSLETAKPTHRIFALIYPHSHALEEISSVGQSFRATHHLQGRSLEERSHISVWHKGDYFSLPSAEEIQDAQIECLRVASGTPPFEVTFDHVASFSGKDQNPLDMYTDHINRMLSQLVCDFHPEAGWTPESVNFTPHLTMLYDRQNIAKRPIEPVSWMVKEIVLVVNLLGVSRYIELGRYLLCG